MITCEYQSNRLYDGELEVYIPGWEAQKKGMRGKEENKSRKYV